MPTAITLHGAAIVIALGVLVCLGWQSLAAIYAWVATIAHPALIGLIVLIVVILVLVLVP